MINIEWIVAVLIGAVALGVLVGMVTAWIAVQHFNRRLLGKTARREQAIEARSKLLDEQRGLQLRFERELREAASRMRAESRNFDEMISDTVPELPHPNQFADTVAMPAVNDAD